MIPDVMVWIMIGLIVATAIAILAVILAPDEDTAFDRHATRFARSAAKRLQNVKVTTTTEPRRYVGAGASSAGADSSAQKNDDPMDFLLNYSQNQSGSSR